MRLRLKDLQMVNVYGLAFTELLEVGGVCMWANLLEELLSYQLLGSH